MRKTIVTFLVTMVVFSSCSLFQDSKNSVIKGDHSNNQTINDLHKIIAEGKLRVVVDYNSISYFVYKGNPMGFQYEILKALANDLGVELHISVNNSLAESVEALNQGKFDLIAKTPVETSESIGKVNYTEPLAVVSNELTHSVSKDLSSGTYTITNVKGAKNQYDFTSINSNESRGTIFDQHLQVFSNARAIPVNVQENRLNGVSELMDLMTSGEIDYAYCDGKTSFLKQKYYPYIDPSTPIYYNQKMKWAISKSSTAFESYLSSWISNFKKTEEYRQIYTRYFEKSRENSFSNSLYFTLSGNKISKFDKIVKEISQSYSWDWRLISSVICQESRFDQNAESWAGAKGLMQLMPVASKISGNRNLLDPRENIISGIHYLDMLDVKFESLIPDKEERIKFVLASYNLGLAHIYDARNLAIKHGKNPSIWKDNVEFYLIAKSQPKYFTDDVVKWGYCNGSAACKYVDEILERYRHYCNLLPEKQTNTNQRALASLSTRK